MTRKKQHVRVNAAGRRVGESHPRAKLLDHEIDLIRELADDLLAAGNSLRDVSLLLGTKFEVHPRTIVKYVYCELRAQTTTRVK